MKYYNKYPHLVEIGPPHNRDLYKRIRDVYYRLSCSVPYQVQTDLDFCQMPDTFHCTSLKLDSVTAFNRQLTEEESTAITLLKLGDKPEVIRETDASYAKQWLEEYA